MDQRLTRADTPLCKLIAKRGLTFDQAAEEIREIGNGEQVKCGGKYLALIARNGAEPRIPLAKAIVEWCARRDGERHRAIKLSTLIPSLK